MVVVQSVCGQAIGTWKSYLAYTNTTECAEANNLVYAIADGSMFSYNKTDKEIVYYSKENGLSDNEIGHIGFNESINTLLITYANGNLDLLNEQGIYNIPFLKSSVSIQDKTINSIYFHNEFAYLSTEFGIMVVNMKKREIKDTYKFDKAVLHVGIVGNKIYAATSGGLFTADTSSNLLDHNNWQKVVLDASQLNEKEIKKLEDEIKEFGDLLAVDEDLADSISSRLDIIKLIHQLPPKQYEVFILVVFKGLKYKQVAKLLHISVQAVSKNYRKALAFINKSLEK